MNCSLCRKEITEKSLPELRVMEAAVKDEIEGASTDRMKAFAGEQGRRSIICSICLCSTRPSLILPTI